MAVTLDPSLTSMLGSGNVYNNAQITAANNLSNQIENASTDEDTLQACKDFEAYMLEQIFKRMNESAKLLGDDEEEESTSSAYVDAFEDNYYQDIAKKMMSAGQGVGIAEQLYQSITNQKLGISKDTTPVQQAGETATPVQQAEEAALAAESTVAGAILSSDTE